MKGGVRMDEYHYGPVEFKAYQEDLARLEQDLPEHLDICIEEEVDGTGAPFCGCSTCIDRATIGYIVAWTITMVRTGRLK